MPLCSRCQSFDIQVFSRDTFPYRGYPLSAVVQQAVRDNCSFCSLVVEYLTLKDGENDCTYLAEATRQQLGQKLAVPWLSVTNWRLLMLRFGAILCPIWVHFGVVRAEEAEDHASAGVVPQPGLRISGLRASIQPWLSSEEERDPSSGNFNQTKSIFLHLAADPGTPASVSHDIVGQINTAKSNWDTSYLDRIKTWQKQCAESHYACRRTLSQCDEFDVEDVPLPTRCIEVLPYQQNGSWRERWILRYTAGQRGRYIALSHRWRPETSSASTRADNIRCRMEEPCGHDHGPRESSDVWRNNTRLFHETGHIAMLLGIRYVWIDSICIIQGQNEDFNHEATKMADYYQHAWLTIAATTMSREGGLIKTIATEDLPRVTRLPYRATDGRQQGHLYVQCADETALDRDYKVHVSQSELLQRGWVFQEWVLSRRLVLLSNSGLFLTCPGAPHPQSVMGDAIVHGRDDWREPDELRDIAFSKYNMGLGKTKQAIWEQWRRIVEIYSRLQLTQYEKDRLVALAGLAREFGRAIDEIEDKEREQDRPKLPCLYISGMWFGDIHGLLWEQSHEEPWMRVKGIPTWSWASMGTEKDSDEKTVPWHGMSVRWDARKHEAKQVGKAREQAREEIGRTPGPPCSMEGIVSIPVSEQQEPQWERFDNYRALNESAAYSGDNRFTMLKLRGRMALVNIGGLFETQESNTAAKLTNHRSTIGRYLWRHVSTIAKAEIIIGWASLEHPDFKDKPSDGQPSLQIFAFFVSDIPNLDAGLAFGNFRNSHIAYKVLFLKESPVPGFPNDLQNCYERVGTGRLFGAEVNALYQSLDKVLVILR